MSPDPDNPKQPLGDLHPHVIDVGKGNVKIAPPKTPPVGAGNVPTLPLVAERRPWHRYEVLGCFALMMVAIQLALGPKIQLSQWDIDANSNAGVAEGVAWLHGHFDIPPVRNHELQWDYPPVDKDHIADPKVRLHDTAYNPKDGKYYNVFPPLFSILTVATWPFHKYVGMPETMWRPETMALLIYWPLCITAFVVFYRRLHHPIWAAVLAFAFIGGTAVLPNLNETRHGYLGQMDHVVSQIGLLILAADLLGRQRIWPALIGLFISTYTRQITFLYGLLILFVAAKRFGAKGFVLSGLGLAVIAGPLLTLNYEKFGNPLDFGYKHIYAGREESYMGGRCLNYGTFSPKFIFGVDGGHGNLYYMHIAPPALGDVSLNTFNVHDANQNGTSLWITTPMAFWVFIAIVQWWREKKARWLMLATIPVMVGLAMYHSPGFMEHGYARFALDFLPIWLLVVAPYSIGGKNRWRTWLTLGFAAWGLLYFNLITPNAGVRAKPATAMAAEMTTNGQV